MASSSSSSSLITFQSKKYDVFISFRGADIRDGFLSHLQEALRQNEVNTFVDEKLDRGEEISSSLLEIIEQSYFSLVIFSENYAYSPWCLEELVKILECMKDMEQMVLPVFYCIDPTHVQELTGSFGAALAKHREVFNNSLDKVESWCQALREIAGIAGLVSHNIKPDSELIKEIVKHISEKLNDVFPSDSFDEGLVGIDSRVKDAQSLLCLESTRVLGIWGMGGTGKTTIAEKLFDRISDQFNRRCFAANVREKFEKYGPDAVRKEILFQVLGRESCNLGLPTRRRLSREKVLIALDDVSDSDQIERSIGKPAIYGPFSKFIITSRDKQLLRNMEAQIYEVEKLNDCESSCLFRFHAFKQDIAGKEYMVLSEKAVEYAQGIPLAIKVLGSNLYGRSVREWADELEKLQSTSDEKIQRILRLSYDALSAKDKEIFLDIVCFFKGEDVGLVENILDIPGSIIGISRLADMSLISIAKNKLHIHDLLQQMGKDIICEEKRLGQRSRLWHPKDIYYLLTRAEGTGANKGISLDMSKIREVELSPTVFERMYNLKFLKFYCSIPHQNRVNLSEGIIFLPEELRLLHWYQYPLKSLLLSSCAENLVDLRLTNSKIKELWNGVQHLGNLKYVDLSDCKDLIRLPDLSRCPNLEVLDLMLCTSLVEIPSPLKHLSKLTTLNLMFCEFCFPGSQLPQWIKYQNDCGSSFFLSFTQLEQVKSTYFTFFVVFDPKVCHPCHVKRIGCTVHSINESGHSQYQFDYYWGQWYCVNGNIRAKDKIILHSEHIFVWRSSLNFRENSMVFQFLVEYINKGRSYNGIVKCGIHVEEEEEPPLKRLKHEEEQTPHVAFKVLGSGYDFPLGINTITH